MLPGLEFRRVSRDLEDSLAKFFAVLQAAGDYRQFHPHPLTSEEAGRLAVYEGDDLYYVATDGIEILAYGILRGWDEGFAVPSLGIALHPKARGTGLGQRFMLFLHAAAKLRGARQIRLKVYKNNLAAQRLYQRVGYRFETETAAELVGVITLDDAILVPAFQIGANETKSRDRQIDLIAERIALNIGRQSTMPIESETPFMAPVPLINLFLHLKFFGKRFLPYRVRAKLRSMPSVQRVFMMFEP